MIHLQSSRCNSFPCQVSCTDISILYLLEPCALMSYSTLGVPPERQKVMISGTTLQDDDWGKAKPKIKEVSDACVCESVNPI